jgi:hypothetical protein
MRKPGRGLKPNLASTDAEPSRIAQEFDRGEAIDAAIDEAAEEAILFHKRIGNPIATWKDGKVVWIAPEDIPI